MRDSEIDSLSADGAQESYPADSAEALRAALSLAVSMIRSGEPMSKQAEQVFEEAFQASAPSPAAEEKP